LVRSLYDPRPGDRPGVLKVPPDSVARSGAATEAVTARSG
jgi:hypothetical protein